MNIENLMLLAVNHLAEGVVVTNAMLNEPEPTIIFVNNAMTKMTGYSKEEIVGKTPRVLQGNNTDLEARKEMREYLKDGLAVETTIENYRKNGTTYWVDLSISPVFENGQIVYYIAVQKDITELKKLEDTMEEGFQEIRKRINKLKVGNRSCETLTE